MKILSLSTILLLGSTEGSIAPPRSQVTKSALNLRGGADLPITKNGLTKFATAYFAVHGALGAADAGKYWETFELSIQPGSLAAAFGELNGWCPLGISIMGYISLFTSLSPQKTVAYGTLPCFFWFLKYCFSGNLKKLGFKEGLGTFGTLAVLAPVYMVLSGTGDPNIATQLLYVPPFVWGVMGLLNAEASVKPLGLSGFDTPTDVALYKFASIANTMWAVFAYSILEGKGPFEAMKYTFAAWALAVVDVRFIRQYYKNANMSEQGANGFTAFVFIMTALFYAVS